MLSQKIAQYLESLRDMTLDMLKQKLASAQSEFFQLKMKNILGQLENPMLMKLKKREIARIKTIIREKELGIDHRRKIFASKPYNEKVTKKGGSE